MQIQWYPGHMTKARRAMQEDLKLVDLVIEITDARAPLAGRNPDIDRLAAGKARMILLNKADLADDEATAQWIAYWKEQSITAIRLDARNRNFRRTVLEGVLEACREKLERDRRKGILNRPIRAMVAGIPNVGKSTFINSFAGKTAAKTGNKPGVTKGNQWIRIDRQLELLDTPGILWPKFDDEIIGLKLAAIGSISDEVLELQEVVYRLLRYLDCFYPRQVRERYPETYCEDTVEWMENIAALRGCLKKKAEADLEKTARLIADDFRSGRIGRITLEHPQDGSEVWK